MKSLWFKSMYVDAILDGTKTTTVRRPSPNLPAAGELAACTVGPRPPFAVVLVHEVSPLKLREITTTIARADGIDTAAEMRRRLIDTYPGTSVFVLVRFTLTSEHERPRLL